MAKGKIIYGKDWLTDIKFPNLDKPFPVYYWDVWMVMFDKFVPLAEELGTKNWMPIENLAKIAEKHQKNDLTKQVYEAALKDKASYHYNNLKKKYEELCERV